MTTIFVDKLPKEKIEEIEKTILKHRARLIHQGKKNELSFDCEDEKTRRLICDEIVKIQNE